MNQYYSQVSWLADGQVVSKIPQKTVEVFKSLLEGGYESISYSGYPTGLIKIGEAEVKLLRATCIEGGSNRLRYVKRALDAPYVSQAPKALLHLNSYKKVESFNDYSDLEVETLINYGFPAIYCSYLGDNKSGLSDCSEDIVLDRLRIGSVYNRGIRFDIKHDDAFFFIDRKAANLFRTQHLKSILQKDYFSQLCPAPTLIDMMTSNLKQLLAKLSKTEHATLFLERIIDFNRKHPFSTVSSAMFELTHYWLNQQVHSVVTSNRIMQDIDPSLKKHWTMRGYNLGSIANVADVLDGQGLDLNGFAEYIKRQFLEEFSQYYGDSEENLKDVVLDNLFFAEINQLETVASLDPSVEAVQAVPRIPAALKDFLYYDEDQKKVIFRKSITGADHSQWAPLITNNPFLRNHLYKLAYVHVKESIGAEILRIIKLNKLGYVATTFQPDNRGEYFLLASVSDEDICARRIHVGISRNKVTFTELGSIDVSFAIKTHADFDPTLNYFLPENNILSLKTTRAKRFMQVRRIKESYVADIFNIYYAPKIDKTAKQIIVAFPFFKERNVLVENIKEFIQSHKGKGDLHILLISNLPQREFDVLLSRIEVMTNSDHRNVHNAYLYPINTVEINAINLWMSNKILGFILGIYFTSFAMRQGLQVDRFYLMESDIFNAKRWWAGYAQEEVGKNDSILLDFLVFARNEADSTQTQHPLIDIKENIFYELFEKPLMQLIHGGFSGVITGSSYCLGPEAVNKIRYSIQKSPMVQSIEWHMLNTLSLLNTRQLWVGQKIHYASSVIDDRFGHRILGLFEGLLENYRHLLLARLNSSYDRVIKIDEGLANVIDTKHYASARQEAIKVASYFDGVYTDVLGKNEYRKILKSLRNDTFTFDEWISILLLYFKTCQGKSQGVMIELLNSLQPLSVLAFGSLMGKSQEITKSVAESTLRRFGIIDNRFKQSTQQVIQLHALPHKRQLVVADIHGEYGLFCDALTKLNLLNEGIIKIPKGSNLVIAGDVLDCYSEPSPSEIKYLSKELLADSSIEQSEIEKALRIVLSQKTYLLDEKSLNSLDKDIGRQLFNAYKNYKLLQLIWQSSLFNNGLEEYGTITFLLGNHEVDLLNGRLLYCSLQKSFLLNMLGINGVYSMEFRDFKKRMKPIYSEGKLIEYINQPQKYIHSIAILNWLANSPIGASLNDILILHSGPSKLLIANIENGKLRNKYDIDVSLRKARDAAFISDEMYFLPGIFDFKDEVDLFIEHSHKLRPLLSMYGCRFLAIGHSPYLNFQIMGMNTDKPTIDKHRAILAAIGMANDTIIKLDSGVKDCACAMSMLILLDTKIATFSTDGGVEKIFDFSGQYETNKADICNALDIANLIERIKT